MTWQSLEQFVEQSDLLSMFTYDFFQLVETPQFLKSECRDKIYLFALYLKPLINCLSHCFICLIYFMFYVFHILYVIHIFYMF